MGGFGNQSHCFPLHAHVVRAHAFVFGLAPAPEATRGGSIKPGASQNPLLGSRLRSLLIAVQLASCMVLLVVTESLQSSMPVLNAFLAMMEAQPVIQAKFNPAAYGYPPAAARDFLERARARVLSLQDVEDSALTLTPMMRTLGGGKGTELEVDGRPAKTPGPGMSGVISDGGLRVFGLRLAAVVLINEAMARDLFPGSNAVGQRIRLWSQGNPEPWWEVIGVVAEAPLSESGAASRAVFRPFGREEGGYLQVRTRGDRTAVMVSVQRLIREMDPRISASVVSLRQGGMLVAGGTVVGGICAAGAQRMLAADLRLLPPSPVQTYVAIAAFLGVVALAAMLAPSLRAARVNPVTALRHDG